MIYIGKKPTRGYELSNGASGYSWRKYFGSLCIGRGWFVSISQSVKDLKSLNTLMKSLGREKEIDVESLISLYVIHEVSHLCDEANYVHGQGKQSLKQIHSTIDWNETIARAMEHELLTWVFGVQRYYLRRMEEEGMLEHIPHIEEVSIRQE